jgi:hypothetical protein
LTAIVHLLSKPSSFSGKPSISQQKLKYNLLMIIQPPLIVNLFLDYRFLKFSAFYGIDEKNATAQVPGSKVLGKASGKHARNLN